MNGVDYRAGGVEQDDFGRCADGCIILQEERDPAFRRHIPGRLVGKQ